MTSLATQDWSDSAGGLRGKSKGSEDLVLLALQGPRGVPARQDHRRGLGHTEVAVVRKPLGAGRQGAVGGCRRHPRPLGLRVVQPRALARCCLGGGGEERGGGALGAGDQGQVAGRVQGRQDVARDNFVKRSLAWGTCYRPVAVFVINPKELWYQQLSYSKDFSRDIDCTVMIFQIQEPKGKIAIWRRRISSVWNGTTSKTT